MLGTVLMAAAAATGWTRGEGPREAEIRNEKVPAEVVASAVKAVADLGKAVVQGKYQMALERMNPVWKQRNAKRLGGMEELERRLQSVADEMNKHGITMTSCKPQGEPQAFGVNPVMQEAQAGGGSGGGGTKVSEMVHSQWLVLVPTVTRFRILKPGDDAGPAEWIHIESLGYQVAVSNRDKEDWTFIDGAALSVNDLRSIYGTLPQDMQLPKVGKRQTRD